MSLRFFHIFFIIVSSLMAFGIAAIEYANYKDVQSVVHLIFSIACVVAGFGLMVYCVVFFKKTRSLIIQ